MEIVIKLSKEDLASLAASGKLQTTPAAAPGPKRGRPPKENPSQDDSHKEDAGDVDEDDEEFEDDEDAEADEPEYVEGDDLKKVKQALSAFSKADGKSKSEAVKVLHKFAKSSEKVEKKDLPKLLKALKV